MVKMDEPWDRSSGCDVSGIGYDVNVLILVHLLV